MPVWNCIALILATAHPASASAHQATTLAPAVASPDTGFSSGTLARGDVQLCSLNVVEWDLSKTLRLLGQQTKTNLVLLSDPGTKLTLRLDNVPLSEMVRHICALSGIEMLRVGTTYVFATEEKLKAGYSAEWVATHPAPVPPPVREISRGDETVDERVTVSNVGAQQAIEAMTKLLGDKSVVAVVAPSASSPSLSSRDTTAATGIAANLVQRDSATDGVSRVILLRGPRNAVAAAIGLIKGMDAPRLEVSIGVTVHDVENDVAKNLGLSWTYGNIQINEDNPNGLSLGSFSRAPLSFSATIAALETKSKSKLLAAPNVTVLDGERAFILIGSRLTFPVLIGYSQANTPIFNTQEERVGIYLQVAARISPDGTVTLSLYPQVSTVSGYIQVNGASYPQIATTEAQTTLQVKSGETIVLGGLMHDQELSEIDKVPILSSIPLLGELFKNRTRSKTSSQILITLTPVIQKPSK